MLAFQCTNVLKCCTVIYNTSSAHTHKHTNTTQRSRNCRWWHYITGTGIADTQRTLQSNAYIMCHINICGAIYSSRESRFGKWKKVEHPFSFPEIGERHFCFVWRLFVRSLLARMPCAACIWNCICI